MPIGTTQENPTLGKNPPRIHQRPGGNWSDPGSDRIRFFSSAVQRGFATGCRRRRLGVEVNRDHRRCTTTTTAGSTVYTAAASRRCTDEHHAGQKPTRIVRGRALRALRRVHGRPSDPRRPRRVRLPRPADRPRLRRSRGGTMTRHAVVWCVNTVLLSESIYTRFSMLNVEDYVDSTSVRSTRLSKTPVETVVRGGRHV